MRAAGFEDERPSTVIAALASERKKLREQCDGLASALEHRRLRIVELEHENAALRRAVIGAALARYMRPPTKSKKGNRRAGPIGTGERLRGICRDFFSKK